MKHRIVVTGLVLLILIVSITPGVHSEQGPISRKVLPNAAQSLAGMPELARQRGDSIVIGVPDLFGETNPFWARTIGDEYLVSILYDELLFSNSNGEMGAGVATYEWTHVPAYDKFSQETNARFVFSVRDNVCYEDGERVTSDDFINAIYLLAIPGFDGVYDISRAGIVGFEAYQNGESGISGVERIDDRSFSVTFLGENPSNLDFFSFPALRLSLFGDMKRPAEYTDENGNLDLQAAEAFYADSLARVRNTDATKMAYGQYTLSNLQKGEQADFVANPSYWRGAPLIGSAQLLVVPVGREFEAVVDGTVDIISLLGSINIVDANLEAGYTNLYTWEGDIVGFLGMDLKNPLFSDVSVRQALAIGFNREKARSMSTERYGKVPNVILFDAFSGKQAMYQEKYAFDLEKANTLLTEAGWILQEDGFRYKDGEKFSFAITYNVPNPIFEKMLPVLSENYGALGLDVALNAVSFEALLEHVDQNAYDMVFQARRLPSSLTVAANYFTPDSWLNPFPFADPWIEQALWLSTLENDPARQAVYLEMIFRELYESLPFIPIYRRMEMLLANARVMNITVTTPHDITSDMYRFFLVDKLEGQF